MFIFFGIDKPILASLQWMGLSVVSMTNHNRNVRMIAKATALGIEVVIYLVVGYYAGKLVARWTGSSIWMFWGVMAGLSGSILNIVLFIKKYLEDMNE